MSHPREAASEHRSVIQHVVRCVIPVLILAAGGCIFWLMDKSEAGKREDVDDGVPEVTTSPVLPHAGSLDIEVDGIVTPFRDIDVAAEVGGRIKEKAAECRAGNFVRQGTLLVEIDSEDYDLDVLRYEKQQLQAYAELEELEVEISNVESLMGFAANELRLNEKERNRMLTSDVYSDSERDQTERAVIASQNAARALENQKATLEAKRERSKASTALAEVQLRKAKLDRSRTLIKAPIDGVIVRDSVEQGSYVQRGSPLFVIEDTSRVEVRCSLQMDDLYWLLDQDTTVAAKDDLQASAYQVPRTLATVSYEIAGHTRAEYTWQGELRRYDGIGVDERTRTIPCRVVVDDPRNVASVKSKTDEEEEEAGSNAPDAVQRNLIGPLALVRGMYVTVVIHAHPTTEFVQVPDKSIQPGRKAWRVTKGKLDSIDSLRLVKYIDDDGKSAEPMGYWLVPSAESRIKDGDRMVITPIAGMTSGMEIREKPKETETVDQKDSESSAIRTDGGA